MKAPALWFALAFGHVAFAQIPGLPANPDFVSAMPLIWHGQYDPRPGGKGPVTEILFQEFRRSAGSEEPVLRRSILPKYDRDGHEIDRLETEGGRESRATKVYQQGLPQSSSFESKKDGNPSGPTTWEKWKHDAAGRLQDFQRGRGDSLQNHYLNFRYDDQGRVTSVEYRQGAKDEVFSRTEIKYSGSTVETTTFDRAGDRSNSQVQVLNSAGRVTDLRSFYREWKTKEWKLSYHVAFRYDAQGRIVEQLTDPYVVKAGDDGSPLPGRVVTTYDDGKQTRDQRYYEDGKLAVRLLAQLDREGASRSIRVFDAADQEPPTFEIFPVESGALVPERRAGRVDWEVVYDDRGNWTERRRWFSPAEGGPRILMRLVKQTIRYQE